MSKKDKPESEESIDQMLDKFIEARKTESTALMKIYDSFAKSLKKEDQPKSKIKKS